MVKPGCPPVRRPTDLPHLHQNNTVRKRLALADALEHKKKIPGPDQTILTKSKPPASQTLKKNYTYNGRRVSPATASLQPMFSADNGGTNCYPQGTVHVKFTPISSGDELGGEDGNMGLWRRSGLILSVNRLVPDSLSPPVHPISPPRLAQDSIEGRKRRERGSDELFVVYTDHRLRVSCRQDRANVIHGE